jgi:hypothetical protein
MTQKHVQVFAYAVFLILGVRATVRAETKKEGTAELLPAPKCCSETAGCCAASCYTAGESCPAAVKKTGLECRLGKVCSVDFKDTPLQEALDHFRESAGVNIVADEPALAEAGVSLQRPITLRVDGIPLKKTLQMLLHQVHLTYVVQDEVVMVTTEWHARGRVTYRIHPVGDLMAPADPVLLPLGHGEVILGWSTQTPAGIRLLEEAPEDTLINLITESIAPTTWCDSGGSGTIDYFAVGKSLVVNQTPDVQEQIAELLGALRRSSKEDSAGGPVPTLGLHVPPAMPFACPPPNAAWIAAAPLPPPAAMAPRFFAAPVPPPQGEPGCPAPPLCPPAGLMPMQAPPIPRAYVLQASMFQCSSDAKAICVQNQQIAFRPEPSFHCNLMIGDKEDKECRKWLLQVKATALKNERLHLEVIGVQAKAQNSSNGEVALDLAANQLIDAKVKLGKTVKKILERDEQGKPRKRLELVVKEMEQAPMPAVYTVPAPTPIAAPPMAYMAVPPICQAAHVAMPPLEMPPALAKILECTAWQAPDQPNQPWGLRATVEDGKTKIALQHGGSLTCDNLQIKLNTGQGRLTEQDTLKLSVAGDQIQVEHSSFQACADAVSRMGPDGCLVFEGHVKLTCGGDGQPMNVITAERVLVDLAEGQFAFQGKESTPRSSDDSTP